MIFHSPPRRTLSLYPDSVSRTTSVLFKLLFSGDCGEGETPVPIPNTAVKPLSADGTARASAWESRSSPGSILERPSSNRGPLFCCFIGFLGLLDSRTTVSCRHLMKPGRYLLAVLLAALAVLAVALGGCRREAASGRR